MAKRFCKLQEPLIWLIKLCVYMYVCNMKEWGKVGGGMDIKSSDTSIEIL